MLKPDISLPYYAIQHTIYEASLPPHKIQYKSPLFPPQTLQTTPNSITSNAKMAAAAAARRRSSLVMLKHLIKKLQTHLQLSRNVDILMGFVHEQEDAAAEEERIPDDVKEGQFPVLAKKKDEEKPVRFVVELSVLKHPSFLRLLKLAEDEFGFNQNGTLKLPCQPDELQRILQDI